MMKLAVFGSPIAHSRSPQIHQAFAKQHGRVLEYERILAPPEEFADCLAHFQVEGGVGANITVPLKELAMAYCDALSPRAEQAGAVNTLIQQSEQWLGHNTDGDGLVADLVRYGVPLRNARVLLVGAGGAVRGVIGPLLDAGVAHLHIVNRTVEKAEALVTQWQKLIKRTHTSANKSNQQPRGDIAVALTAGTLASADDAWDIIINGTSSGLEQQRPALPDTALQNQPFCYDMVYGAVLPPFLQWAQAHGCAVTDGLGMLVEQAALSYFQWTGDVPDTKAVLDSMRNELNNGS